MGIGEWRNITENIRIGEYRNRGIWELGNIRIGEYRNILIINPGGIAHL